MEKSENCIQHVTFNFQYYIIVHIEHIIVIYIECDVEKFCGNNALKSFTSKRFAITLIRLCASPVIWKLIDFNFDNYAAGESMAIFKNSDSLPPNHHHQTHKVHFPAKSLHKSGYETIKCKIISGNLVNHFSANKIKSNKI